MKDHYQSIAQPSQGQYKEKGSKFLAFAYPVTSVEQARQHLERLRKEYFDARHHCYAYAIGSERQVYRANDDGEPSGTAGRPILGQLQSFDVSDVLIVVVRYFGGILLGASGLTAAYKTAAREALAAATIVPRTVTQRMALHFGYAQLSEVERMLKEQALQPAARRFEADCTLEVDVPLSQIERLQAAATLLRGVTVSE